MKLWCWAEECQAWMGVHDVLQINKAYANIKYVNFVHIFRRVHGNFAHTRKLGPNLHMQ